MDKTWWILINEKVYTININEKRLDGLLIDAGLEDWHKLKHTKQVQLYTSKYKGKFEIEMEMSFYTNYDYPASKWLSYIVWVSQLVLV
jgi:hypothetical protein